MDFTQVFFHMSNSVWIGTIKGLASHVPIASRNERVRELDRHRAEKFIPRRPPKGKTGLLR
jgi:hypothetical protein